VAHTHAADAQLSRIALEERSRMQSPELAKCILDGYCTETRSVFEFYCCYYHGCLCKDLRDVKMLGGKTLAQRY
jgi:hypothetical protein